MKSPFKPCHPLRTAQQSYHKTLPLKSILHPQRALHLGRTPSAPLETTYAVAIRRKAKAMAAIALETTCEVAIRKGEKCQMIVNLETTCAVAIETNAVCCGEANLETTCAVAIRALPGVNLPLS